MFSTVRSVAQPGRALALGAKTGVFWLFFNTSSTLNELIICIAGLLIIAFRNGHNWSIGMQKWSEKTAALYKEVYKEKTP